MEEAWAAWFQVLASLAFGIWGFWLGHKGLRPQEQVASSCQDNKIKEITHATCPKLNKHPNESEIKGRLKLEEHPEDKRLHSVQEAYLHHYTAFEY